MAKRSRRAGAAHPPIPASTSLVSEDHPTASRHNWLAKRQLGNAVALAAERHARGRLVDIGCGLKPYASAFAPHVEAYVGVDHPESPHALTSVDVLADAYSVPLPDGTFQTAVMFEVLEHLERPADALAEAARLLDDGGTLILSTPFVWPIHEAPRDFFRYSPHGLRHLAEQAGFRDIEVTPLAGQWSTLALLASYAIRDAGPAPLPQLAARLASGLQRLAVPLDRVHFRPWMSWGHLMTATRSPR